jgi:hypothetical protein
VYAPHRNPILIILLAFNLPDQRSLAIVHAKLISCGLD